MNLIIAVDAEWGIGLEDNLLYKIPEDLKNFKEKTEEKIVIMGRKTYESLPDKKPLSNRLNIVMSSKKIEKQKNVISFNNFDELFEYLKNFRTDDIYVIGGSKIYVKMLKYCKKAYVTKLYDVREKDVFGPNLDVIGNWKVKTETEMKKFEDASYNFLEYENKKVLKYDKKV